MQVHLHSIICEHTSSSRSGQKLLYGTLDFEIKPIPPRALELKWTLSSLSCLSQQIGLENPLSFEPSLRDAKIVFPVLDV